MTSFSKHCSICRLNCLIFVCKGTTTCGETVSGITGPDYNEIWEIAVPSDASSVEISTCNSNTNVDTTVFFQSELASHHVEQDCDNCGSCLIDSSLEILSVSDSKFNPGGTYNQKYHFKVSIYNFCIWSHRSVDCITFEFNPAKLAIMNSQLNVQEKYIQPLNAVNH